MIGKLPKDAEWLRRSFMVPVTSATHQYDIREVLNGAAFKFTDTTPGGSYAINPPPQFTLLADRPTPSMARPKSRYGGEMGRYYSESLDDHKTEIHMRFGVRQFNSLLNFVTNAYNHEASVLARTGRAPSGFYKAGNALGTVVTLPFQAIIWANQAFRFLTGKPSSRFYYLKPAMPVYWAAVSSMVNAIGVNMGQIGRSMSKDEGEIRGDEEKPNAASFQRFQDVLPEIYRADGGIDVYAMATRAQRLAHVHRKRIEAQFEEAEDYGDLADRIQAFKEQTIPEPDSRGLEAAYEAYHKVKANEWDSRLDKENETDEDSANEVSINTTGDNFEGVAPGFSDYAEAELEDGASFVTFRVDDAGPVSESFSNSVEESELAGKINSMSSSARSSRFSLAHGNIGDGVVASTIEGFLGGIGDFLQGAAASVGLQGLNVLAGSAFVDIPKTWSGSTANLPSASYTIELRSPYGNNMSRLQNLYIPLAMLLAGALPLSTGKQSYTSPFICEIYSKGRNQSRLGMIDSLSITRGTGNLGFNKEKQPLAIDVTFSVTDLSGVLHMPVNASLSPIKGITGMFDDDNAYTDYMAVLGGLSLTDQIYPTNKLRIRRANMMANWEQWKSPAYHANWLMGSTPGRLLAMMTKGTDRGL